MGITEAIAIGIPGGLLLGAAAVYVTFRRAGPPRNYGPRPTYTISPLQFAAEPHKQPNRGTR